MRSLLTAMVIRPIRRRPARRRDTRYRVDRIGWPGRDRRPGPAGGGPGRAGRAGHPPARRPGPAGTPVGSGRCGHLGPGFPTSARHLHSSGIMAFRPGVRPSGRRTRLCAGRGGIAFGSRDRRMPDNVSAAQNGSARASPNVFWDLQSISFEQLEQLIQVVNVRKPHAATDKDGFDRFLGGLLCLIAKVFGERLRWPRGPAPDCSGSGSTIHVDRSADSVYAP